MKEYHKIQSIFKRHTEGLNRGQFIMDQWAVPEFEYLKNNIWTFDEKIDGTNIRVDWDGENRKFGGRTDRAQIPTTLYERLETILPRDLFQLHYPNTNICLYGEGYGAKIQKGGGNYISDGVDFILFDVKVDDWWLLREDVEDVAQKLELKTAPIVGEGTLFEAISLAQNGITSQWGDFRAEGFVMRPKVPLFTRRGDRIITKVKCKDFKH